MQTFQEADFDNEPLRCPSCRWQGRGTDTTVVDFYGLTDTKEAHCPQCDAVLAAVKRQSRPRGQSPDDLAFQIG